jgi:hydrogenase maturation protease
MMHQPVEKSVVVIGYGNTLRGDDAAGRLVVEELAKRNIENVELVSVTQLVPELAALVARANAAIFVDACLESAAAPSEPQVVSEDSEGGEASHHTGPHEIMAIAQSCFHATPPAWLIRIPGVDFESTGRVSATARAGAVSAIDAVLNLITRVHEGEVGHA